jgi:flagellar basal-body rod protein FlgB
MFINRLLNQGNAPLLEQMVRFAQTRHRLLAENVVNITTPNYRQKDLSPEKFQAMLQERLVDRNASTPGSVGFDDLKLEIDNPRRGILFHDGNNRSMEQLMTDQAKNALMHNMYVEMLRKQYGSIESALKERVG